MARTAIVIGTIVVCRYVNDGASFDLEIAACQEERLFFRVPFRRLRFASYVNRPSPRVVAKRSCNESIDSDLFTPNQDHLGCGRWSQGGGDSD